MSAVVADIGRAMTRSWDDGRSSTAAWDEVLDRLEAELEALETALEAGEPLTSTCWTPPHDLGEMPVSRRERAGELGARLRRAQEFIHEHLIRLGGELHEIQRQRRAGEAYARSG